MSHTLTFASDNFTLYVDGISNKNSPIIAKHQILDATYTTMQYMGAESQVKTIQFHFENNINVPTISTLAGHVRDGRLAKYTDDTGTSGSFVVTEFSYARAQALNQPYAWFRCSMTMTNTPTSGSLYYQWVEPEGEVFPMG
jgi:hypothetical protein